ncbi:S-adenosylmethionine-dependent methyltransferase [Vermiconidia calcicola]|uniref:S-adenosylmethionine-dependent methyltransferase n=1 Tax=Vermiconidia calcicola TaxID=1690605 RepID=A0ACC3MK35_9PEZI|nr:S-adenosylmethionine-dependent methyltransferase [Vermiconidia calcicola]
MSIRKRNEFLEGDESDEDLNNGYEYDVGEESKPGLRSSKRRKVEPASDDESLDGIVDNEDNADTGIAEDFAQLEGQIVQQGKDHGGSEEEEVLADAALRNPKSSLKTSAPKRVAAAQKAAQRSGVVYISRVPPFMKPQTLRHFLAPHASKGIGRVFLTPEDHAAHTRRVKSGGNKKKSFTDGWVEFVSKREAKIAAETLNGNIIGGKKGNFYHDDLWNMKYLKGFKWSHLTEQIANENAERAARMREEMDRAIAAWSKGLNSDQALHAALNGNLKFAYTRYGCMLLLSQNTFDSPDWQIIRNICSQSNFDKLYEHIARHIKVTHIAINKPIPAINTNDHEENVLRAPSNFTPVYGDFGPSSCSSPPNQHEFDAAFWVTAKQNNVFQTWAPRWTMFSRGNISEKARLLTLPSVQEAVEQGMADGRGCAAVDLYAGIGYFAFSYLKAGVDKVLCWDLNPWSIEGLKRGALTNKWSFVANEANNDDLDAVEENQRRLCIFNESNELAAERIGQLRDRLPPVRHVNCGLLPTSRASWQVAVKVMDPHLGGWVHVHENFAVQEIEQKSQEVRSAFQHMVNGDGECGLVNLDYVHRLKSYAPGVMHCVIDIHIPPHKSG